MSITSNDVGSGRISRNMILPNLDEILPVICHILNYSHVHQYLTICMEIRSSHSLFKEM